MPECRTCLFLSVGRRLVRCGSKAAPRAALPHLEACERWERAEDALSPDWVAPAPEMTGPWSRREGAHDAPRE